MLRRDGEVFFFGTAMASLLSRKATHKNAANYLKTEATVTIMRPSRKVLQPFHPCFADLSAFLSPLKEC